MIADMIETAVEAPGAPPGSDEWQTRCSSSKLAAILGVSPWQTPFEVWHRLAGHIRGSEEPTPAMLRGTHLESGIIDWWHAMNPDWEVEETGTWQSKEHPWLYDTPDSLALDPSGRPWTLEVKTTTTWDGWGPDGSITIPPYYGAQTICHEAVMGVPCLVIAVGPDFKMRTYVRDSPQWMIDSILDEVRAFLDTLPGGPAEQEPEPGVPVDLSAAVASTPVYRGWARRLDDDDAAAEDLAFARIALDEARARFEAYRMILFLSMDEAEALKWRGRTLMSRRTDGSLYVADAETLRGVIE